MNNQEAAEMIRDDMKLHHDYLSGTYRKALSMAISALEKQIPKKPKKIDHWRLCPTCYEKNGLSYDYLVGMKQRGHEDVSYCLGCGQAIDWEEK